jgi:hypothetical protein
MTRFVLAVILVVASTLVASNVATAASNPSLPQSEDKATSVSGPDSDFPEFRHAGNSSRLLPEAVPREVAQWISNVCQTSVGWCTVPAAPVGYSCYCNFNGYTYWGRVQ